MITKKYVRIEKDSFFALLEYHRQSKRLMLNIHLDLVTEGMYQRRCIIMCKCVDGDELQLHFIPHISNIFVMVSKETMPRRETIIKRNPLTLYNHHPLYIKRCKEGLFF